MNPKSKFFVDHVIAWGRDIYAVREVTYALQSRTVRTVARCDVKADAEMIVRTLNAANTAERVA